MISQSRNGVTKCGVMQDMKGLHKGPVTGGGQQGGSGGEDQVGDMRGLHEGLSQGEASREDQVGKIRWVI